MIEFCDPEDIEDQPDLGQPELRGTGAVAAFQVGTPTTVRELARISGVPSSRIAEAQAVARHAPDLFASVLATGTPASAAAYEAAAEAVGQIAVPREPPERLPHIRRQGPAGDARRAAAGDRACTKCTDEGR